MNKTICAIIVVILASLLLLPVSAKKDPCGKHNGIARQCIKSPTLTPTKTKMATLTITATRTLTNTTSPTATAQAYFYQAYAQVSTALYEANDANSALLAILPVNARVLFLDYNPGDRLIHVRYTPPFDGQDIVAPIDGWVNILDLGQRKVGTPTYTPLPRCYDC